MTGAKQYVRGTDMVVSFSSEVQKHAVEKILAFHGRQAGEYLVQCIGEEFGHEGL